MTSSVKKQCWNLSFAKKNKTIKQFIRSDHRHLRIYRLLNGMYHLPCLLYWYCKWPLRQKKTKKLTLGRLALVAGTQQTLAIYFETFDIYGSDRQKNGQTSMQSDRLIGNLWSRHAVRRNGLPRGRRTDLGFFSITLGTDKQNGGQSGRGRWSEAFVNINVMNSRIETSANVTISFQCFWHFLFSFVQNNIN